MRVLASPVTGTPSTSVSSSESGGEPWRCTRSDLRPPFERSTVRCRRRSDVRRSGTPCRAAALRWLITAPAGPSWSAIRARRHLRAQGRVGSRGEIPAATRLDQFAAFDGVCERASGQADPIGVCGPEGVSGWGRVFERHARDAVPRRRLPCPSNGVFRHRLWTRTAVWNSRVRVRDVRGCPR